MGPSGVLDQSLERTSLPISPPPTSQFSGRVSLETPRCVFSLLGISVLVMQGFERAKIYPSHQRVKRVLVHL